MRRSHSLLRFHLLNVSPKPVESGDIVLMPKLVGLLFGLVFGSVGIGMAGYAGYQLFRWYETQNWVQVPATIDSLDLRVNRGEGTSYGVDCTYHFDVDGQKISGSNPSFYGASDNLGSFQQNLHERLKEARSTDTVKVWIDPSVPERSVLDRTFRSGFFVFSQIFGLVFGSIGISIFTSTMFTRLPYVRDQVLNVESSSQTIRVVCRVMTMYLLLLFLMGVLPTMFAFAQGHLGTGLICLVVSGIIGAATVMLWRTWRKHRDVGRLMLPTKEASTSEPAKIVLPPKWQGPIDMDVQWTIPRPPSNELRQDDDDTVSGNVDSRATEGTLQETHIPIVMPLVPNTIPSGMPVKLEVKGTIGGYHYSDKFEIPAERVESVAFPTS